MNDRSWKVGDRVAVVDQGLARLREVMRNATGQEPTPNHHGTIQELTDDSAIVLFDDTESIAPYPLADLRELR